MKCHGLPTSSRRFRRWLSSSQENQLSPLATGGGCSTRRRHHDLPSFLAYASQNNLATDSTTYVGTHYEYTVQKSLARLGMRLTRSGGRLDRGIDLTGYWRLPPAAKQPPLKVLIQCKALARKPTPSLVRELEGTFTGARLARREEDSETEEKDPMSTKSLLAGSVEAYDIALLVTPREATKGVRETMGRSQLPLGFIKADLDGLVEQLLWNQCAANKGLQGLGVTLLHRPPKDRADPMQKDICLTWMGQPL